MDTRTHHPVGRMLIKSILFGLLALVLAGSTAGRASAQGSGLEQIEAYIDRTEELLLWAKDLVTETQSVTARRVLTQAADMHQRSRGLLANGRPLDALEVSRRSRAALWHSVRLAREAMGLEERIRIRAERFRDQHSQLMERALEAENRQALEFLRRSENNAVRAREQFHQGDFKLSWKMLEKAGDLMRRAARLLADGTSPERLEMEIERTRMLIERTREGLGDDPDPRAHKMLAEAEEALVRAREGMEQGQPGRALQMTGLARQLAIRAGSLDGDGPADEAVRRQLERFDHRSGRVGDAVRESGSEPAREMYERALQHRTRAAASLADGDGELALRQIRAAHDLLGQAEDLIR
ncbi:MAG: hypothetical protein ABFS42_14255 [Candidatus Krumholzibacteriota bacterium]